MATEWISTGEMKNAIPLNFEKITSSTYTRAATYFTSRDHALLYDDFIVYLDNNSIYDMISTSYFDPYILRIMDSSGNLLESNTESTGDKYGSDYIVLFSPPYDGYYYISASWNQGSYYKDVSLGVFEEIKDGLSTINVSSHPTAKLEGSVGQTSFDFVLTRSGYTANTITVRYDVQPYGLRPASANDFLDGAIPQEIVTFNLGETSKIITIRVTGDTLVESDESFRFQISSADTKVTLGTSFVDSTILADDSIVDLLGAVSDSEIPIILSPQFYNGPVFGIEKELIRNTNENLTIFASGPNWFIRTGNGTDAIAVTSGINVLDGGTGSNFLSGGSGSDTFFVDARSPPSAIWSTFSSFSASDSATIWGVNPSTHNLIWQENQGAAGFEGLTLHAFNAGHPTSSLTIPGFSNLDISNGTLFISYGRDTASGSDYMHITHNIII